MASVGARVVQALADLAALLDAAGVPATADPTTVQLPGAWLSPRELDLQTLDDGGQLTVHVWLVVPDTGVVDAFGALCGLLDLALEAVDPDEPTDTGLTLVLDDGPMPAFRLVVYTDI